VTYSTLLRYIDDVKTVAEARRYLDRKGIVTLSEYVRVIAGEKPKGSWWGHPKLIFNVTSALEDEVLVCKLVSGQVTFVSAKVERFLVAVVTHPSWRRARIARLSVSAKRLLSKARKEIEVHARNKKAAQELSASLLVRAISRHTESGAHATFLVPWPKSDGTDFNEALAELAKYGVAL
jgi:hypothetical protein